jgi:HPt (histidine-containing phosphotransfer) domain-containing protein
MTVPASLNVKRMETDLCPDPAALERLRSMGGAALLQKMIGLFFEHTPRRLRAAMDGENARDWYQVERAAHSLKSSAANLGLTAIHSLARRVEEMAESGQAEGMVRLIHEIDSLVPAAKAFLEEERGSTRD